MHLMQQEVFIKYNNDLYHVIIDHTQVRQDFIKSFRNSSA